MARLAFVCPPLPGHLHAMFALGRELQRRAHSIIFFHIPAVGSNIRSQGFQFEEVGSVSSEALAESVRQMSAKEGLASLRHAVSGARQMTQLLCEELPAAFEKRPVDLVLADQNEPAAGTVAEHLRLPFIHVCPSLPLNREPDIPPPFVPWPYRSSGAARLRNRIGYALSDVLISPINRTINRYRRRWGMKPIAQPDDTFSWLAQLCQMVPEFDFPRRELPPCFHYCGPFRDSTASTVPFPFERLNGKPLIYASLGTLQARNSKYFYMIAEACAGLDAQLVISTGGETGEMPQALAGEPVVVRYAPQLDLLARASLTITHAGLNTVMQSLTCGVPMLALPITHDQPAIAARVARSGAGEAIAIQRATSARLRAAVERVLGTASCRERAQALSASIRQTGGVERAADIVEEVLRGRAAKPA
jgi:zeaxanthin glucosyltransferase